MQGLLTEAWQILGINFLISLKGYINIEEKLKTGTRACLRLIVLKDDLQCLLEESRDLIVVQIQAGISDSQLNKVAWLGFFKAQTARGTCCGGAEPCSLEGKHLLLIIQDQLHFIIRGGALSSHRVRA